MEIFLQGHRVAQLTEHFNSRLFDRCTLLMHPRTIYRDHPAGCVNQSEVRALPSGCMNQSEVRSHPLRWFNWWLFDACTLLMHPRTIYRDHPAGCVNQSEVRALPSGCMNQSEVRSHPLRWFNWWLFDACTLLMHPRTIYRDHPAGCVNQSEVRALPSGCMNQSEVRSHPLRWFNWWLFDACTLFITHARDTVIINYGWWEGRSSCKHHGIVRLAVNLNQTIVA